MKRFDPAFPFVLGQETKGGFRYFTGEMHPISPDSWTPDIRKARRFSVQAAANMQEHVRAYTWSASIQRLDMRKGEA